MKSSLITEVQAEEKKTGADIEIDQNIQIREVGTPTPAKEWRPTRRPIRLNQDAKWQDSLKQDSFLQYQAIFPLWDRGGRRV
jgi:hypothetical protein